jgi:hypothetical protein
MIQIYEEFDTQAEAEEYKEAMYRHSMRTKANGLPSAPAAIVVIDMNGEHTGPLVFNFRELWKKWENQEDLTHLELVYLYNRIQESSVILDCMSANIPNFVVGSATLQEIANIIKKEYQS